jgi:predicted DNA-binding transcriptional regulator AlpA
MNVLLINEVAALLKVSPSSITRFCENRRKGIGNFPLPISTRGGKRRWLQSDVENYLASQSTAMSPVPARKQRRCAKAFTERQSATDRALERFRGKESQ